MAEILYGPWTSKRDVTQISLDQFKESQQLLLGPMIEAQQALLLASHPFKTTGNIRPVHCRKALNALEDVDEGVFAFCRLLRETDILPIFIASFRYQLLATLHRLQEEISDVIVLTDTYRTLCTDTTYQANQKRFGIYQAIKCILNDLKDFITQLGFFDTEINFQEERLTNLGRDEDACLRIVDNAKVHFLPNVLHPD